MRGALVLVLVAAATLPPATGWSELEAPRLDSRVLQAGHAPDVVQPHMQWNGYVVVSEASNVTDVSYQVCRVGFSCFAPPAPAQPRGSGIWTFDTANYTVAGPEGSKPVDYQAGWRIGVTWILRAENGTTWSVPPVHTCGPADAARCLEDDYLVFQIAQSPTGIPNLSGALAVGLLLFLAGRRRG